VKLLKVEELTQYIEPSELIEPFGGTLKFQFAVTELNKDKKSSKDKKKDEKKKDDEKKRESAAVDISDSKKDDEVKKDSSENTGKDVVYGEL
jgi:hypothetical protein